MEESLVLIVVDGGGRVSLGQVEFEENQGDYSLEQVSYRVKTNVEVYGYVVFLECKEEHQHVKNSLFCRFCFYKPTKEIFKFL